MSRPPVVKVERDANATRVRVSTNGAEVWVRATNGGRRLSVAIEEGDGSVDVEWSIRRASEATAPVIAGPFVQSPYLAPYRRTSPPEARGE